MPRKNRRRKPRAASRSRRSQPGSVPGTLVVDPQALRPVIQVMAYGPDTMLEQTLEDISGIRSMLGQWPVTWINVIGLGDVSIITRLGEIFDLHRLALEDVINVHQRAKVEQYPG